MASSAVARDTVFALRRTIASIEGSVPERFEPQEAGAVSRTGGLDPNGSGQLTTTHLTTGVDGFDAALGGGLPLAALTEIHGAHTRDAGCVAGFGLVLATLAARIRPRPLLWIGLSAIFAETGMPYPPGIARGFGIDHRGLLLARAQKLADALWIAEEAASLTALCAVVLEIHGNPARLDLTATRRLHRRAQQSGRPLLLLRHAGHEEPTAAPVRLIVSPAVSGLRRTLGGAMPRSIGPPAFDIVLSKSRAATATQFTLEWDAHDCVLHERRPGVRPYGQPAGERQWPAHHGAVLSLSRA